MKHDYSKFVRYEKREKTSSGKIKTSYIEGLQYRKGCIHMFAGFNTFRDEETKIPVGYRKKGIDRSWVKEFKCDVEKTQLLKDNEIYIKIKKSHAGYKRYFIFSGGDEVFVVYINKKNRVSIYKKSDSHYVGEKNWSRKSLNNLWIYTELVAQYNCTKVFIGKSPLVSRPEKTGVTNVNSGSKFDGNSILLQLEKNKYVFVGNVVYEFAPYNNDDIVKYYSPVGNNKVPYPVAIGKNCIYFMLDKTYVFISSTKIFNTLSQEDKVNLYSYYYGKDGEKPWEKLAKKMKLVKFIDT